MTFIQGYTYNNSSLRKRWWKGGSSPRSSTLKSKWIARKSFVRKNTDLHVFFNKLSSSTLSVCNPLPQARTDICMPLLGDVIVISKVDVSNCSEKGNLNKKYKHSILNGVHFCLYKLICIPILLQGASGTISRCHYILRNLEVLLDVSG